ncbi:hypothetical protein ACFYZJ_37565 [Streptomyces sp. NPDC001848]|uniref:hypothetical protein n=1 Tax=Streptomyces sp. NPDC001848 TaxID=3364618 RepID=UPI0036C01887
MCSSQIGNADGCRPGVPVADPLPTAPRLPNTCPTVRSGDPPMSPREIGVVAACVVDALAGAADHRSRL